MKALILRFFSPKRIYIACETDQGKLKGYIIYPGKTNVDEFYFNNFEGKDIRNPVFAKFEKSLGIFYTHIKQDDNYNVAFHYFTGKVFLNNPYPFSRAKENITVKFEPYYNMSLVNVLDSNKKIQPGENYDSQNLVIKITPKNIEGIFSIPFMVTRMDDLDGLIEGKTCRITFNTPKCLDQCKSCDDLGNE